MKIYWYWPHAHRASSALCRAVMRPGDSLTVHAVEVGPNDLVEPIPEYDVIRDLPDPSLPADGVVARITRRPRIALGRSIARARVVRQGFDVAHIGNLAYQTDWLDLRRLRRHVSLVCDVHDVRPHRHALPSQLETAILREEYRNGGHLIVLHDLLKQEIVADFGLDAERVHVVPHVLDASVVVDYAARDPARPVLLVFGTLRANKGLDVLADALASLGARLSAEVVIAGSGDEATTAMLKQRLGLMPNVTLEFGRVGSARKAELFSAASWCVLPYTEFHSQSGVLADAYAYRVPLIVSDVGAIGPTVRSDATGIVIAPRDPEALADAILRAIDSPLGAFSAALDSAARGHDVTVVGPTLRQIYEIASSER